MRIGSRRNSGRISFVVEGTSANLEAGATYTDLNMTVPCSMLCSEGTELLVALSGGGGCGFKSGAPELAGFGQGWGYGWRSQRDICGREIAARRRDWAIADRASLATAQNQGLTSSGARVCSQAEA